MKIKRGERSNKGRDRKENERTGNMRRVRKEKRIEGRIRKEIKKNTERGDRSSK